MVGRKGFALSVSEVRIPLFEFLCNKNGGSQGIRTPDLLGVNEAL